MKCMTCKATDDGKYFGRLAEEDDFLLRIEQSSHYTVQFTETISCIHGLQRSRIVFKVKNNEPLIGSSASKGGVSLGSLC